MLLVSCSISQPETISEEQLGLKTVYFGASTEQPVATKATLTPNEGETAFVADWSIGDKVGISYFALDEECEEHEGNVAGEWDGSSFKAEIPNYYGLWDYRACYPYSVDGTVDLGMFRNQDGAEYNCKYDVMVSSLVETSFAGPGLDENGNKVVFPMERQTALAYFHFTSSLDETVVSATLEVKGGYISAGSAWFEDGAFNVGEEQNKIILSLNQNAGDFTLWFNALPCEFESMVLTVCTSEHKIIIKRGAGEYEAGLLYKVSMALPDEKWQDLSETHGGEDDNEYALVSSAPQDWSGKYLAAYVKGTSAYVFNGEDVPEGSVATTVTDGKITLGSGMAVLDIQAMTGGYSIKIVGGANDGKYMSAASKSINFSSSAVAGNITLNSDGTVRLDNGGDYYLQFNNQTGQMRFRYYSTNQQGIRLFKAGSDSGDVIPVVTDPAVTTGSAQSVGLSSATLYGSYSNASTAPTETGFYWGTSASALTNELYVDSGAAGSGEFSKTLGSLSQGATYYYKAYVLVDGKYYYGSVQSFTTAYESTDPGVSEYYAASWLAGYEIPATSVSLSSSSMQYDGRYCHSTVSESFGDTKACIYNTSSSSQRIVTHTFSYNGKVLPTYTILYDQDKHCALWEAFEMGGSDYKDNGVGRNDSWCYDPAIPSSWQPNLGNAYQNSYTRGHAIASNYRQTTTAQNKQTFYYSNMTPQTSTLNNGNWNTLEQAVKGYSSRIGSSSRLFVVTGPIFESGYSTTKDKSGLVCPVPTKYYKCLMLCTFDSNGNMTSASGAAYVFNHSGDISRQNKTIDEVETMTGFDFFANVPDVLEAAAEKTAYRFF